MINDFMTFSKKNYFYIFWNPIKTRYIEMVINRLETKPVVNDSFQRSCTSLSWKATTPSQKAYADTWLPSTSF